MWGAETPKYDRDDNVCTKPVAVGLQRYREFGVALGVTRWGFSAFEKY